MEVIVTKFLQISCVVLGGLTGCLIAIPLAVHSAGAHAATGGNALMIFAFTALGTLIGYRRRTSRVFLYFCIGAILILSSIMSFSLIGPQKG